LNTPGEDIPLLLQEYVEKGKQISQSVYEICIYGNGITREEAFNMTYKERKMICKIIDKKRKAENNN